MPSLAELRSGENSFKAYITGISNYNKGDLEASMKYWLSEIGKEYDENAFAIVECRVFDNVSEILQLNEKQYNILYATSTIDFLILRDKINVEAVALTNMIVSGGDKGERYVVVTSRKSEFKTVSDLKKANISISKEYKGKSILYYWVNSVYQEYFKSSIEKSSKSIVFTDDSKQALTNVFFGNSDACLIEKSTYTLMKKLNPQIDKKLNIITESEDFITSTLFLSKNFDQRMKTFIIGKIMTLNSSEQGRQISKVFKLNGITSYNESMISSVKKLYSESKTKTKK